MESEKVVVGNVLSDLLQARKVGIIPQTCSIHQTKHPKFSGHLFVYSVTTAGRVRGNTKKLSGDLSAHALAKNPHLKCKNLRLECVYRRHLSSSSILIP